MVQITQQSWLLFLYVISIFTVNTYQQDAAQLVVQVLDID